MKQAPPATRIKDRGRLSQQFHHVIDIVATLYEVIGIPPPTDLNDVKQKPIEGTNFAYVSSPNNLGGTS